MIEGVVYKPLRRIPDDRGTIWHMLKKTDDIFTTFGEIYFTSLYPGIVKAWHVHQRMDLNYACIVGSVRVVLFDDRNNSPTRGTFDEYILGEHSYGLLHIPHGVTNGMQCLGQATAVVANCATLPHDPAEMLRVDPAAIDFDWS